MTGRERLTAAARGGAVDRRPVLCWPTGDSGYDGLSDGYIATDLADPNLSHPDRIGLKVVVSPFARRKDLLALLDEDPAAGDRALSQAADETRADIDAALSARADGVCYVLAGANPASSTPMQYGGHFLEVDREILTDCQDAAFNLLWVRGKEEPYLDFVIDLPAHAFAWDMVATGITPSAMKQARGGAVAGAHPEADIYLVDHHSTAAPWLEAATP